ncbi:MAG: cysteine--tRNA ligase [Candidatus Jorgensenbacteria bacterium]
MKIYDSLSRNKKQLPHTGRKPLHLFVCGPTVYDYAHIGHARTYLVFDTLARYLRSRGARVFYLQNITNVDDKIIDRARRDGMRPLALARKFEKEYRMDMKALGITAVNRYARVSDFIPDIVRQVRTLFAKGYAYRTSDGYYFNIAKFSRYGRLAGRTAAQAEDAVSRIDEGVEKKNRGDFVLWKFIKTRMNTDINTDEHGYKYKMKIINGEPAWETPLGWGRPGWHIEDTAISEHFFGPQYDIHGGGVDLKFPHHESEIAQQEAASGKRPFVKIWIHAGTLLVEGKKMAKSAGNFITIRKFLEARDPAVLRWIVLQRHYRSPVNYTPTLVAQAERALTELQNAVAALKSEAGRYDRSDRTDWSDKSDGSNRADWSDKSDGSNRADRSNRTYMKRFNAALDDDLNTPRALAVLWETVDDTRLSPREKLRLIFSYDEVLGLGLKKTKKPSPVPASVMKLVQERELSRARKQFTQADALREQLLALGYVVRDTPQGPLVQKANSKFQAPNNK